MGKRIIKYIKKILYCLVQVIYSGDESCVICSGYSEESEALCTVCRKKLRRSQESFYIGSSEEEYIARSVFYYSSIVKELIIRLKYKNDFICGEILAKYMLESVKNNYLEFDLISYVPMTKRALKNRGYNQSEFLAKYLSQFLSIPVTCNLIKTEDTKDQIGLSGDQRWDNMKKCFEIKGSEFIKNKNILLVDDVITTGATAFHCAHMLKENGANNIFILTIAKSNV
ncbi:ComF family protein [Clostridium estertheticum]|uniref:ComF family protein n=1 Tax=Clostridium estertheticum TaxID=238834 RepID=UPI001C0BE111|nr:ComF family protein [Clostridium estertheticum]MBU3074587.1 ComF family protein [Clostridium estertheticum]MBU3164701.1 ComF family protein [Clostridium estertheticum]